MHETHRFRRANRTHRETLAPAFSTIVAQHAPRLFIAGEDVGAVDLGGTAETTKAALAGQASIKLRHG